MLVAPPRGPSAPLLPALPATGLQRPGGLPATGAGRVVRHGDRAVSASRGHRRRPSLPAPVKTFLFKGRTFQAIPTDERGESEERELRALSTFHARAQTNDGEHFAGVARKAAKTSSAIAPVESFASPGAVLDSILMGADPSNNDQDMRRKLNANSPRARRRSATSP